MPLPDAARRYLESRHPLGGRMKEKKKSAGCEVCGEPYNYAGTGLCGPCCTGEAATYGEGEYVGD